MHGDFPFSLRFGPISVCCMVPIKFSDLFTKDRMLKRQLVYVHTRISARYDHDKNINLHKSSSLSTTTKRQDKTTLNSKKKVQGLFFDLLLTLLTTLQPDRSMLNLLEQISIKAVCNGEPCICWDLRCKYRLVLMPLLALDPPQPGVINPR